MSSSKGVDKARRGGWQVVESREMDGHPADEVVAIPGPQNKDLGHPRVWVNSVFRAWFFVHEVFFR